MNTAPADLEVREMAWQLRQPRRRPAAGMYPGAGRGRYSVNLLGGIAGSKHARPLYWRGGFAGWRFTTKPHTSADARRTARKAQRVARRGNR